MNTKSVIKYLLYLFLVSVLLIELVGRYVPMVKHLVDIVNDPDHRMRYGIDPEANSDGIRMGKVEAADFSAEDFNILFLGDSFIYGLWLSGGDSIPGRFEQLARAQGKLTIRTANFAWISSSPYLSLRLLRDIGEKYKPDLVVYGLDMTDAFDDAFYENIVERRGMFAVGRYLPATTLLLRTLVRDVIHSDRISKFLFGVPYQRYFIVEKPLAETRSYMDNLLHNVDDMERYARETLHVPFVLFVLPRYFQYNPKESPDNWEKDQYSIPGPYSLQPFHYFEEVTPLRHYPIVSLLSDFQHTTVFPTTMPNDAHFSTEGAGFAAEIMYDHLQQLKLLPPATP